MGDICAEKIKVCNFFLQQFLPQKYSRATTVVGSPESIFFCPMRDLAEREPHTSHESFLQNILTKNRSTTTRSSILQIRFWPLWKFCQNDRLAHPAPNTFHHLKVEHAIEPYHLKCEVVLFVCPNNSKKNVCRCDGIFLILHPQEIGLRLLAAPAFNLHHIYIYYGTTRKTMSSLRKLYTV